MMFRYPSHEGRMDIWINARQVAYVTTAPHEGYCYVHFTNGEKVHVKCAAHEMAAEIEAHAGVSASET